VTRAGRRCPGRQEEMCLLRRARNGFEGGSSPSGDGRQPTRRQADRASYPAGDAFSATAGRCAMAVTLAGLVIDVAPACIQPTAMLGRVEVAGSGNRSVTWHK